MAWVIVAACFVYAVGYLLVAARALYLGGIEWRERRGPFSRDTFWRPWKKRGPS